MRPPSRQSLLDVLLAGAVLAAVLPSVAAAQAVPDPSDPWVELLAGEALGAVLGTLVIGGLLILLAPEYTETVTDRSLREPGTAFLWGLGLTFAVIVGSLVLALTVVGLLIAVPLLLAFSLYALVASEVGFLAAGRLVSDDWGTAFPVALIVAAVAGGVPLLGGLIAFVLSCIGIGAVAMEYTDDDSGGSSGGSGEWTATDGIEDRRSYS